MNVSVEFLELVYRLVAGAVYCFHCHLDNFVMTFKHVRSPLLYSVQQTLMLNCYCLDRYMEFLEVD
jgi:hypothetical protein